VAGIWTGSDHEDLVAAGVTIPSDGDEHFRHRLRVAGHVDDGVQVDEVVVRAHRAVAGSPCMIATAAMDDVVGAPRRPNVPGTIDEHPNWRTPLPVLLDDLPAHALAEAVTAAMGVGRMPEPGPASG
jgi:4-alpha-glucanotransferase